MTNPDEEHIRVAVGPAGGSIAESIIRRLADSHRVVALSAAERGDSLTSFASTDEHGSQRGDRRLTPGISRIDCDFFSRIATRRALQDSDAVVFLAGALAESSGRYPTKLTQGEAIDLELNRADNVARAAAHSDVRHVLCIQYRPFDDSAPSADQLRQTFSRADCRLTFLRCSIILDPRAPFVIAIRRALSRFPVLFLPRWSSNKVRPTFSGDMIEEVARLIGSSGEPFAQYDASGTESIDLRSLIIKMRDHLGLMCRLVDTPFDLGRSTSKWLASLSGVPSADILASMQAFRTDDASSSTGAESLDLQTSLDVTLDKSLSIPPGADEDVESGSHDGDTSSSLAIRPRTTLPDRPRRQSRRTARSIQQLPVPAGRSASWIAREYTEWLPGFFRPFLRVDVDDWRHVQFFFRLLPWPLLELSFDPTASDEHRQLFWISGGLLARDHEHGRLEFRSILDGTRVLACVHDFEPRLPWLIYRWTQALVHAWVMHRFGAHLDDSDRKLGSDPDD